MSECSEIKNLMQKEKCGSGSTNSCQQGVLQQDDVSGNVEIQHHENRLAS